MRADMPAVPVGGYPVELECDVLLSDGRTARIRPIVPEDADALRDLGSKLSSETVYFRFFSPRPRIGDEEIAHYVTVDYQERLALVAVLDGELVAVARYDRCPSEAPAEGGGPAQAEVAFVVRDDHQGRGIGTVLLEHLASAAFQRGIGRFVADTLPENYRMLNVFRSAGFAERALIDSGVVRVTLELDSGPEYLERVEEREWTAAVRSMERILRPSSVVVAGDLTGPASVGASVLRNLQAAGFSGELHIAGAVAAPDGTAHPVLHPLPGPVDLGVLVASGPALGELVAACGASGVGGVVLLAPGEEGGDGRAADRELVELARRFGMRLVGPECMGVINTAPQVRLNASVAPHQPQRGRVAFAAQSGGLGIALLSELTGRGLGISQFISLGDKADVSGNDLLRFWASDEDCDVILLYLESFGNPRKFSRIARRVARRKPIVAVKSARTVSGSRGARSKSSMVVPDEAIDALFRQAGVIRVPSLEELLDVTDLLDSQHLPPGRRVAILASSGGCGVLTADACEGFGLEVPELGATARTRLEAVSSPGAVLGNPVELAQTADASEYGRVLDVLLADDGIDAVIVTFTSPVLTGAEQVARSVSAAAQQWDKPVLANFAVTGRILLALRGGHRRVPLFAYPESAARALARVAPYAEWLRRPEGAKASFDDVDPERAREIVQRSLAATAGADDDASLLWMATADCFELLSSYGIATLGCRPVKDATGAVLAAGEMGWPVALKLDAPRLVHKSDVGGVLLDLHTPEQLEAGVERLRASFGPGVGLVVQPMGPVGVETVVGMVEDPSLGPLLMFGMGGKEAELFRDQIWSLVPMTIEDVVECIDGLRSSPLLTGYRGAPVVDRAALADVLARVACLAEDVPEIAELSLNPVVAGPDGAVALDARIRVAPAEHDPALLRRAMRSA